MQHFSAKKKKEELFLSCRKSIILTTITFLIMTVFCAPSMAAPDNSDPAPVNISQEWLNPIYAQDNIVISVPEGTVQAQSEEDPPSVSSLAELRTLLLPAFNARQSSIEFTYTGPSADLNQMQTLIDSIHADDDYLKFNMPGWTLKGQGYEGDYQVTLTLSYLTTLEQENYVDQAVTAILSAIIDPGMNSHQRLKAVHDYVVANVAYDTDYNKYSAYNALYHGQAVCQGYALLTYKMLTQEGFAVRIVSGSDHAWNRVRVDDQWYNLDCTWDDPTPDVPGRIYYSYYNLSDAEFYVDHEVDPEYTDLPAADTLYLDTLNTLIDAHNDESEIYLRLRQQLGLDYLLDEKTALDAMELESMLQTSIQNHDNPYSLRYYSGSENPPTTISGIISKIAPSSDLSSYSYSYRSFNQDGSSGYILLEFEFTYWGVPNAAPSATEIMITGNHSLGQTLTGTYNFNDVDNDPEGISQYQWYRGSQSDGSDFAPIPGAIGSLYTLNTRDQGKYLFFQVTPVAGTGTITGSSVLSPYSPADLLSIAITNPAGKLIYYVGDELDISGLIVTGSYSDGSSRTENISPANISGFDSSVPATDQLLTISVEEHTTTYQVQILELVLESIAISNPADKLEYYIGDELDISGLVVTGTYNNGSRPVPITVDNITGFDSSQAAADQLLTITVGDQTITYTVQIKERPVDECFIATAAFGSKFDWPVALLRQFRDQYLLTNSWGHTFVNFYYQNSPTLAAAIASSEPLKMLVRILLAPIIAAVYMIYHPLLLLIMGMILLAFYVLRKQPA